MLVKSKRIEIYIDGSSLGIYGYYIPSTNQKIVVKEMPMTNNTAEYLALLQLVMDLENESEVIVYTDSQLLYHQIRDEWRTKVSELGRIKGLILTIIKQKDLDVEMRWVERESNLFGKMLDKDKERAKKKIKKYMENVERYDL